MDIISYSFWLRKFFDKLKMASGIPEAVLYLCFFVHVFQQLLCLLLVLSLYVHTFGAFLAE